MKGILFLASLTIVHTAFAAISYTKPTEPCPAGEKRVCVPTHTFKKECNTCVCNQCGTGAVCTPTKCGEQVCIPNSTFKQKCNTCVCNRDGTAANCTTIACSNQVCVPNSTFTRGCNACVCDENGIDATCTFESCREHTCVPNSTFQRECNTCTCNKYGYVAACTERACAPISNWDVAMHPQLLKPHHCKYVTHCFTLQYAGLMNFTAGYVFLQKAPPGIYEQPIEAPVASGGEERDGCGV